MDKEQIKIELKGIFEDVFSTPNIEITEVIDGAEIPSAEATPDNENSQLDNENNQTTNQDNPPQPS
jgi:hypothetical protein